MTVYSRGDRVEVEGRPHGLYRVVFDLGPSVVVCTEEEFQETEALGKILNGVSYPKESVKIANN